MLRPFKSRPKKPPTVSIDLGGKTILVGGLTEGQKAAIYHAALQWAINRKSPPVLTEAELRAMPADARKAALDKQSRDRKQVEAGLTREDITEAFLSPDIVCRQILECAKGLNPGLTIDEVKAAVTSENAIEYANLINEAIVKLSKLPQPC